MMEPAQVGSPLPRAFLRLGGVTLAQHQLLVALAAGCERIACVAKALDADLIALQHAAERAGARFHMISGPRGLSGLVTANDELLVFADGLVPSVKDAVELIGQTPVVLVMPAESAVPLGYERIDLNHASAGLMLLPGSLAERLNDLSPDAEAGSALLRIALQAGITQRLVPQGTIASGHWLLIRNEDQAQSAELDWMDRHTSGRGKSPGLAIATFAVRSFGPALLHAGTGGRALALASLLLLAMVAGLSWFGWFTVAIGFCAPAWLLHKTASIIEEIQSDALGRKQGILAADQPFGWLFDIVLAGVLVFATAYVPGEALWQRAFGPFMLFGLLLVVKRGIGARWSCWAGDRMALSLVLCALSFAGWLAIGVPALAAAFLLVIIFVPSPAIAVDGITRA